MNCKNLAKLAQQYGRNALDPVEDRMWRSLAAFFEHAAKLDAQTAEERERFLDKGWADTLEG